MLWTASLKTEGTKVLIAKEQTYLLSEVPEGLVIVRPGDILKHPGQQKLVMCDKDHLVDYLIAYLSEREAGKPLKEAHEEAMRYAKITKVRDKGRVH